jgi:CheY-like chemotaxis protein
MSPEQEKRAFEAFFTTSPTGTGLGLWMVNHRARSMGGHVKLSTKLGQGTRFEIHLPVCASLDAPRARLQETSSGNLHFSHRHLILFVEDEPLILQGVQRWLESLGLEVIACSNGHEAVAAFRQNAERIKLILQDYMLPGISGGDLLKIFTQERPDIPVVVMSAFASGVEESGLLQKGAVAFLPKPFRMADLVEMVHKQIENR